MVTPNAYKDGNGNIIISEDSFEYLLNCLDNQKFINSAPQNQPIIDRYNIQCRNILNQTYIFDTEHHGYYLYKTYNLQDILIKWSDNDLYVINNIFKDKKRIVQYNHNGNIIKNEEPWLFQRPLQYDLQFLTISEDGKNNRPWKIEEIEEICKYFNAYKYKDNDEIKIKRMYYQLDNMDIEFIDKYLRKQKIEKIKNKIK